MGTNSNGSDGQTDGSASRSYLTHRGGTVGAVAPLLLFVMGAGWLGLSGAPDERGFWPVLVAAQLLGLALAVDRTRWAETVVDGMADRLVALMILAWMLAGILSVLMSRSGFVEALVWLAQQTSLHGGGYVAAAFVACALVSTSTGTSFGTILICGPLLYPAGAALAAEPLLLAGAILGGATFGDSISPISDTTIASSGTQQADIGGTVRSRIRYVVPAALVAIGAALGFGGTEQAPAMASASAARAAGLPMAVVPVAVLILLLRRQHLVVGLLAGVALACVVSVSFGLIAPAQLMRLEPESFVARSLFIDGIERAVGVSVFTLLLVGLVAVLRQTTVLGAIIAVADRRSSSARGAESWIVGAASAAVLLTTHSVVAILAVGEFARITGERHGVSRYRRANLLDTTVCTWPFLLPYFLPTILMAGATADGVAVGFPRVTPLQAGLSNVFSWALLAVVMLAVATGWGREGRKEPRRKEGRKEGRREGRREGNDRHPVAQVAPSRRDGGSAIAETGGKPIRRDGPHP